MCICTYVVHQAYSKTFLLIHIYTHLQLAFKWFDNGMNDLEHETQVLMFNTRVLKVDPDKLDKPGYNCLRNFFETINLFEKKLKRMASSHSSLVGVDYCVSLLVLI